MRVEIILNSGSNHHWSRNRSGLEEGIHLFYNLMEMTKKITQDFWSIFLRARSARCKGFTRHPILGGSFTAQ